MTDMLNYILLALGVICAAGGCLGRRAAAKKLGPEAIRDLARKLEFTAGVLDIQGERKKAG